MSSYFPNQHTFYVVNKSIPKEKLISWIRNRVANLSKKLRLEQPLDTEMHFNQVCKQEKSLGFGYLWVMDPRVYNILTGKNPDGSERVIIEYQTGFEELQAKIDEEIEKLEFVRGMRWADFEDMVDAIRDKYQPSFTRIPQAPLIKFDSLLKEEPEFKLGPAVVKQLSDDVSHNVLCTDRVPEWVTESMLKDAFSKFVSTPGLVHTRRIKTAHGYTTIEESYPSVTMLPSQRMAFLTFDPTTRDAQFALLMNTKITITDSSPRSRGKQRSATLTFRHSYNRRKD